MPLTTAPSEKKLPNIFGMVIINRLFFWYKFGVNCHTSSDGILRHPFCLLTDFQRNFLHAIRAADLKFIIIYLNGFSYSS